MASTTERAVWLVLALLAGCAGDEDHPKRPEPVETGTEPLTDTDTIEETGTTPTGDTGTIETGPVYPPCDHVPITETIYMTGDERWDYAGRWVDAGDIDGDGCDEVVVSASWAWGTVTAFASVHSAFHLLQDPWVSGVLPDVDYATFPGTGHDGLDYWGESVTLLPDVGQIAFGGYFHDSDHDVNVHDVPRDAVNRVPPNEVAGSILYPYYPYYYGSWAPMLTQGSACTSSVGHALCVTAVDSNFDIVGDYARQVLLYDLPIVGELHATDYRTALQGDPVDGARKAHGKSDLDGDGINDIAVGAVAAAGGAGRVALVFDVPDGTHRLWDVAQATFTATTYGGSFGFDLTAGDLDADGYIDLWASAPFSPGAAHVFRGPFAGDRLLSEADWTVLDDESTSWLGYNGAIADLYGNGAPALVAGSPWSIYDPNAPPGSVLVYDAPVPGTYLPTDASRVLVSGVTQADAFGMAIETGDFDGDGKADLVIGAPRDPTIGEFGGSVSIVFGASL